MRGFVPDYNLKTYPSLQETLKILAQEPERWRPFAGGTDLMVLFESGKLKHREFLNLAPFGELKKLEATDTEMRIGALSTYTQIQNDPVVQKEFPLLARSGWVTGAKAIQNRGTIGGNIANASPAADTPPSLLAYGARIELKSENALRVLDYRDFHLDYKKTVLAPGEIISAVILPRNQYWTHHYYRKVGTRAFQSISKIAFSAVARIEAGIVQNVQIGLASVGPMPLRAKVLEQSLRQQNLSSISAEDIVQALDQSLTPIGDIRSTEAYRRAVLERVTRHWIDVLNATPGIYLE